jgi:hypothetical protein
MEFTTAKLWLFSIGGAVVIYLLNCLIARKLKPIRPDRALLYISTVAMVGVFGEIFVDTVYEAAFGIPLWRYNVLPVHHAYTSQYAVVLWGTYGFHLYLLHDSLGSWDTIDKRRLALLFGFEALVMEAVVELASKAVFGEYVYYYYPGDLWHISTVQNFPFYWLCGRLIVRLIDHFRESPGFFTVLCSWLTVIIVFMR